MAQAQTMAKATRTEQERVMDDLNEAKISGFGSGDGCGEGYGFGNGYGFGCAGGHGSASGSGFGGFEGDCTGEG